MSQVTSKDGTKITFDRTADGPPCDPGRRRDQHRAIDPGTMRLAALLADRFTVFHYDRRGRGESGDTAPYAVAREVEDIGALIDEAGGTASVFGMSSGAALALEAASAGSAVKKLALYEPPFIVDDSRPPIREGYTERLDAMIAAGRRGDAVELFPTEGVGMPVEEVTPAARRAVLGGDGGGGAHSRVRRRDHGRDEHRRSVGGGAMDLGHDADAADRLAERARRGRGTRSGRSRTSFTMRSA